MYYYFRMLEKMCRKAHIARIVKTTKGIKGLNITQLASIPTIVQKDVEISVDKLHLGTDFLNDAFTLLNCPIKSSPHYDLVKKLNEGSPIKESDYLSRLYTGALDWRYPMKKIKTDDFFIERFELCKASILSGCYNSVTVFCVEGHYYVYDGKHRAAVCALLGKETVKCSIIAPTIETTGLRSYMTSCMDGKSFVKHLSFIKQINKEIQT